MALEGPSFSFFRLKIPFTGLSQKVEKGKQKAFQHPVSCDPCQTVMKIGIGSNRVRTTADFLFLFLKNFLELDDLFRDCILRCPLGHFGFDDLSERKDIDQIVLLVEEGSGQRLHKGFLIGSDDVSSVSLTSLNKVYGFEIKNGFPDRGAGYLEGID
jgi:hypothetical protein